MYCSTCGAGLPGLPPVECPSCGTAHWLNSKPCASAVVTLDGKALLVKRANEPWRGRWDIPGGFCEASEHPIDAAVREVKEETGLAVAVIGFIGIWMDSYLPAAPGLPDVSTLNIYYHADVAGPHRSAPDPAEVEEVGWFSPHELPSADILAFPDQQAPVLEAWKQTVMNGRSRVTPMPDAVQRAGAGRR